MNELTYENVIQEMLDVFPEAESMYQENVDFLDMDVSEPEFPRHPVFSELAELIIYIYTNPSEFGEIDEILNRLFDFIERAANSFDSEVVNLVRVSFLEILSHVENPYFEDFLPKMGPETLDLLREIIIFWHKTLVDYEELTGWTIPREDD